MRKKPTPLPKGKGIHMLEKEGESLAHTPKTHPGPPECNSFSPNRSDFRAKGISFFKFFSTMVFFSSDFYPKPFPHYNS